MQFISLIVRAVICGAVLVWVGTSSDAIHFIYFAYRNLRSSLWGARCSDAIHFIDSAAVICGVLWD